LTGDLVTVRALLANHVDVNNRNDDNGWTVLMVAAAGDHADVVAELVAQPEIEVNARAENDRTALHLAAERGHQRVVAVLGSHPEIDPNAKDALGRTALILAAFNGWAGVVELLLAFPGIDPNLVDRDRQTALHWAALGDHVDVVRRLLGDARTNAGITNRPDGDTAQRVAAAAGRDAAAAVLEERMRSDPGIDELSPGDARPAPPEEAPVFYRKPFVPEPPDLREPE
jgi:ankyrin repeat protein